jgi:hypothetical protein
MPEPTKRVVIRRDRTIRIGERTFKVVPSGSSRSGWGIAVWELPDLNVVRDDYDYFSTIRDEFLDDLAEYDEQRQQLHIGRAEGGE